MSLDAIGLVSQNCEKSLQFYEKLGLKFESFGDGGHYEAQTLSGVRIMIDSLELVKSFNPDFEHSKPSGMGICFKYENASKVNEMYNLLLENGGVCVKSPWDAFWGQRYAMLKDPDGYQIDLFAPL